MPFATGPSEEARLLHDEEHGEYGASDVVTNKNQSSAQSTQTETRTSFVFRLSGSILSSLVWLSMISFSVYIFMVYLLTAFKSGVKAWGPHFASPNSPVSTAGIGIHFLGGFVLLVLGNVQLLPKVRRRYPGVHRWLGRVYAGTAAITSLGALSYIVLHGCIGGITMDIGFGMYGVAMLVTAFQTVRHARARHFDEHRAWALRLFSLGVASWLYRLDYSGWTLTTGGIGHLDSFRGVFDKLMDFSFFVPNLLFVELILRMEKRKRSEMFEGGSAVLFAGLCFFVVYATYRNWVLPFLSPNLGGPVF